MAVLLEERGQRGIGSGFLTQDLGTEVARVEDLSEVAGVGRVAQPGLLHGAAARHEDEQEEEPGETSHGRSR